MATDYEVTEQQQAVNTAIIAAASEVVISGTQRVDHYNHLEVINQDAVQLKISLDSDANRTYTIGAKTGFILDASEGQFFNSVLQTNNDAAAAETAGAILFKAFKKIVKR